MTATVFESRKLRGPLRDGLHERLRAAHHDEPFSTVDPRATVRRVAAIAATLGLEATAYRGGVDLRGSEVDHVWLGVSAPDDQVVFVVDAAFPLFSTRFVDMLRRFVAGDEPREALALAAADSDVEQRVIGVFPPPVRYLGRPVWKSLQAAADETSSRGTAGAVSSPAPWREPPRAPGRTGRRRAPRH